MMNEDTRSGLRNAMASILANFVEHTLHPFDVIRTRMQSHDGQKKGNVVPNYKNISTAFKTILKEEGFRGMYKGMLFTLTAITISRSAYFGL